MVAVHTHHAPPVLPARSLEDEDQRVYMTGLRWRDYEILLAIRGEKATPRMTYRRGVLELMSPSHFHERVKTTLARLLETWSMERGVRLYGYGSWTLKDSSLDRGLEPDECYVLGTPEKTERPDLAIEVVKTSGGMDKLELYEKLRVGEVWIWEEGQLTAHVLGDAGYEQTAASRLLPDVDLGLLASLAAEPDQVDAVLRLRDSLREVAP